MKVNKLLKPFEPYGNIKVPSSKSYSHRYLISAFIANNKCQIGEIIFCDDVKITLKALKILGGKYSVKNNIIKFEKRNSIEFGKQIEICCGESASTLRFLFPLAVYLSGNVIFKCSKVLIDRTYDDLNHTFTNLGLKINRTNNSISAKGTIKIQDIEIEENRTSQIVSGLLFLLAIADNKFSIKCNKDVPSHNYIDMTIKSLNDFGIEINESNSTFTYIRENKVNNVHNIEMDFSSFAYHAVLGTFKGNITIDNFTKDTLQGDKAILDLLKNIGADYITKDNKISFNKSNLSTFEFDVSNCIDLGPIVFALAASIDGKSIIKGIERLKYKESDRISSMIEELSKDNIKFKVEDNQISIWGKQTSKLKNISFDNHNDHRIAMSLTIYALIKNIEVNLKNTNAVSKSYPNFYNDLNSLKSKITLSIYDEDTLIKNKNLIDAAVLMTPKYSQVYKNDFNLDAAIKVCINNNIEPIISINKVFLENELDEAKSFIKRYKKYKFLISDLGIARILDEMHILSNAIYAPDTLVCNSSDLRILSDFGFNTISMSNEIPINDVIKSYQETNANLMYQIFGRKIMFYSKRHLLDLYKEHNGLKFENENISLVEEKRSYHIPVFENENGFKCFRPYNISLINRLDELKFLKYDYVESLTLTNKEISKVLKSIKNKDFVFNDKELKVKEGFENNDSIYVKEKIIQ